MGKIVASGGISYNDEEGLIVFQKIVDLCEKKGNKKVLYVPTAGHDNYDDFDDLKKQFSDLGCTDYDVLVLTEIGKNKAVIEEKILTSDIIFVGGGNLKFLMDVWNETGATEVFKEAYNRGIVLSGSSSGGMCWYERGYDDCGENNEFMFIDCLGIIPGCNCPHYDSEYWQSFDDAVKTQDLDGIAVENDAALVYIDGEMSVSSGHDERGVYLLEKQNDYKKVKTSPYWRILRLTPDTVHLL